MDAANQATLSRLLDEHGASLVLYAQQWCHVPEDVVQEAFVRLMRQRPLPENTVGWLYRVVRNEAVSASRSSGRRARHEAAAGSKREPWFKSAGDDAIDASAAVAALESLPIEQREAIVLRYVADLSLSEVAAVLGIPEGTAKSHIFRGLAKLRALTRGGSYA